MDKATTADLGKHGVRCACGAVAGQALKGDWYRCFECGTKITGMEALERGLKPVSACE